MLKKMYDLHTHTYCSDGTDSPAELVNNAKKAGAELLALTDHDTMMGCNEAYAEAKRLELPFICGAEIEAEYSAKLHILGLGVDPDATCIVNMLKVQAERRIRRNEAMLIKLAEGGYDVRQYYREGRGCTTRTHIALALIRAGIAADNKQAFDCFIGRGGPFFVGCEHPAMRQVIDCITEAGGVAVLAHPHKMRCDHLELIKSLADCGLWGVEVYYPGTTEENIAYFKELAERFNLNVTCGSDYHGKNRPGVTIGCAWQELPELEKTYDFMKGLAI